MLALLFTGESGETGNHRISTYNIRSHHVQQPQFLSQPSAPTEAGVEEPEEWREFEATAYIALCDSGCTGITKSGLDVRNTIEHEGRRVIAVDKRVIPLGTALVIRLADGTEIEGVAEDTGGNIKGARIDVLMADYDDAMEFGRQTVEVRILNEKGAD